MTIPIVFRNQGEKAYASYDYVDIANGAGYVKYYGANTQAGYILSRELIWSDNIITKVTGSQSSTYAKFIDLDFDLKLNVNKTINGKVIVNVPFGHWGGGDVDAYYSYAKIKIKKWDGVDETLLGEETSTEVVYIGGTWHNLGTPDIYKFPPVCAEIDLANEKINRGEYLRVTVEVWIKMITNETGSNHLAGIGHDPVARTLDVFGGTNTTSKMTVHIPYKIDL